MWGKFIMIWQTKNTNTKKIFLLFLSVVLGGAVIIGAGVMSGLFGERKTQEPTNEWQESLSIVPGSSALARIKKSEVQGSTLSVQATTTTDIIAGKLISEYARSQKNTTSAEMSDADALKIATSLAQEISLPPKKEYALGDLNISNDNNDDANLLYIRGVSALLKSFVATGQKETELTIMVKVMDTNNSALLDQLDARITIYQKLINDLLLLKTPSRVAPVHLRLIQGYETMRNGTVGFKKILSDPALGIASLAEYRIGVDILSLAEKDLREFNFSKQ